MSLFPPINRSGFQALKGKREDCKVSKKTIFFSIFNIVFFSLCRRCNHFLRYESQHLCHFIISPATETIFLTQTSSSNNANHFKQASPSPISPLTTPP
jgi:hypothetical protein